MNIAYTMAPARGHTDLLLFNFARSVLERGLRPVGIVQINTERDAASPCDMDVQVLPDGPVIRISQSLGHLSKGCRLDPSVLEKAVATGPDLAKRIIPDRVHPGPAGHLIMAEQLIAKSGRTSMGTAGAPTK